MDSKTNHISKLDGLRGLLSLIVALNHSFLVVAIPSYANVWQQNLLNFHDWQSKLQQLFMVLGNGGAAVTLFFIMSGLVLGQSFQKVTYNFSGIAKYYLKRLIRLYPVYLLLLVFTFAYMKFGFVYSSFSAASTWYNWWMRFEMTLQEFIFNVFFVHIYIGGVTWTLRVILVVSLIFPVIFLIFKRTTWWQDLLITLILIYLSFNALTFPEFRDFRYLFMFYAGLSLPKFKNIFEKVNQSQVWLIMPFMLFLIFDFRYLTDEYIGGLGETLACWLLIGILSYSTVKIFDFLDGKLLKFFGQISYSLYLVHFTVLYIIARFMFQNIQFDFTQSYLITHLLLFVISLSASTVISYLVYLFLEKPSTLLSKKIADNNQ